MSHWISIAYLVAAGSHVLLKNVNNSLPLNQPSTIALFGSDAGPPFNGPNGYPDRGGVSGTLAMGWYVFAVFLSSAVVLTA